MWDASRQPDALEIGHVTDSCPLGPMLTMMLSGACVSFFVRTIHEKPENSIHARNVSELTIQVHWVRETYVSTSRLATQNPTPEACLARGVRLSLSLSR